MDPKRMSSSALRHWRPCAPAGIFFYFFYLFFPCTQTKISGHQTENFKGTQGKKNKSASFAAARVADGLVAWRIVSLETVDAHSRSLGNMEVGGPAPRLVLDPRNPRKRGPSEAKNQLQFLQRPTPDQTLDGPGNNRRATHATMTTIMTFWLTQSPLICPWPRRRGRCVKLAPLLHYCFF
jgi:hypothetical protein